MKEVDFRDRVPTYPGRVTLTPVVGSSNQYDMVRSDEPTVYGTPLDKATFNSIIHSRLTGRYYTPTVTRETYNARTGLTTNPLPSSGWVYDADNANRATSGVYVVETDSNNGSDWLADGAFRSSGWQNTGGNSGWLKIYHAEPIRVRRIKFSVNFQYEARFSKLEIQGSNNGTNWVTVGELTSITTGASVEYELGAPGEYSYYRLYFTMSDSNRVTVSSLSYTLYDINTYTNTFIISEGVPADWTPEQRIMIATPAEVNGFSVINNTLNGVNINAILQQNKRYELRYNGAAFVAKEM